MYYSYKHLRCNCKWILW